MSKKVEGGKMIDKKYTNLLEELRKIKLMDSSLENEDEKREEIENKINKYEKIAYELSNCTDCSIIPYMCSIVEDNATELSAVEYLVRMIFKIVQKDKENGMRQLIKGSMVMIPQGEDQVINMYIAIIRDNVLRQCYKKNIERANSKEKIFARKIIKRIKDDFGDTLDVSDILELI